MSHTLLFLMFLVIGYCCARMAEKRNRRPQVWFLAGVLFGLFALVTLLILGKKEEVRGVDVEPKDVVRDREPFRSNVLWYYLDQENAQQGPLSTPTFLAAQQEGKITGKTYVWNEDLDQWKYWEEIEIHFPALKV